MQTFAKIPLKAVWTMWCAVLCALPLVWGCEACSRTAPLGELLDKGGVVERDHADSKRTWTVADSGAEFFVGDAIWTKSEASARLRLDDGSLLGLEEETLIRFLAEKPGEEGSAFSLELGAASLEAADDGTTYRTQFGLARLEGGSRVRMIRTGDRVRFLVEVGMAELESDSGEKLEIASGQEAGMVLSDDAWMRIVDAASEATQEESPPEKAEAISEPRGPIQAELRGKNLEYKEAEGETFEPVGAGALELSAGSTLRIGAGSGATVRRGKETAELGSNGTYLVGGPGGLVRSESGRIEVDSSVEVRIAVPGGTIVTRGGRATIVAEKERTRVTTQSGEISLQGRGKEEVYGGQVGFLGHDGVITVEGRGLSAWDVDIAAGESVVIHDPHPPTAVGFRVEDVCDTAVLRVVGSRRALEGGTSAAGRKTVALPLGVGRLSYAIHCLDDEGKEGKAVQSGKVTVLKDAGAKPVPLKAPSTAVDVNGRSYTVLYQNQLPQVTVTWSKAPSDATGFRLRASGAGRVRTYNVARPSYTFGSGALSEGTHSFYFEGGGRVSRQTAVRIRFDSATKAASLSAPARLSARPGESVTLGGSSLPGWGVTVDGKAAAQDAGGRFSVKSRMPENGRALVVRLTHPKRGAHLYLRRPAKK